MRNLSKLAALGISLSMVLMCSACGNNANDPAKEKKEEVKAEAVQETAQESTQAVEEAQPAQETEAAQETGDTTEAPVAQDAEEVNNAESNGDQEGEALLPFYQYYQIYDGDGLDKVEAAVYDFFSFDMETEHADENVLIPYVTVVDVDESNDDDVMIYGDFWQWECAAEGDTLVVVSGGNRSGIIHAIKYGEGDDAVYEAMDLEESFTDDDAVTIFGDRYDAYVNVSSDDTARDEKFIKIVADYVKYNQLDITKLQVPGEDVVDLSAYMQ